MFVDPPYEDQDEFEKLASAITTTLRKWPTGIFAVWYPIKRRPAGRVLKKKIMAAKHAACLSVEFLRFPEDGIRLAGSGMIICNPPWGLEERLRLLCDELILAFNSPQGDWSINWLIRETELRS